MTSRRRKVSAYNFGIGTLFKPSLVKIDCLKMTKVANAIFVHKIPYGGQEEEGEEEEEETRNYVC